MKMQIVDTTTQPRYAVGSAINSPTFYLSGQNISGKIIRNDLAGLGILDDFAVIEVDEISAKKINGIKYLHAFELNRYGSIMKSPIPERGELDGISVVLRQDNLPNNAIDHFMVIERLSGEPYHLFELPVSAVA